MEFTGKIIEVLDKKSGVSKTTGKPWSKQEYVIAETTGDYPKKLVFEAFGDEKIDKLNIKKDEELTVYFNIDAKAWSNRWFNTVSAWRVDRNETDDNFNSPSPSESSQISDTNDLPF